MRYEENFAISANLFEFQLVTTLGRRGHLVEAHVSAPIGYYPALSCNALGCALLFAGSMIRWLIEKKRIGYQKFSIQNTDLTRFSL